MEPYQLSDADKAKFRSIGDIDSRAFIITMTEFARNDITRYLASPPKIEKSGVIAQLHVLSKMALGEYGLVDFKNYVDGAITELEKPSAERASFLTLGRTLDKAAQELRKIDSESAGGYMFQWVHPEYRPESYETALTTLKATPLHRRLASKAVSEDYIKALQEYLQTLSLHERFVLKSFSVGLLGNRPPKIFTEIFGEIVSRERMDTVKGLLDACIVFSPTKGLDIETNLVSIKNSMFNDRGYVPGGR